MKVKCILVIYIFFFLSCAGLKVDPQPGAEVILTDFDGIKKVDNIKVWKKPFTKGEKPFAKIQPGIKVKIIKIQGPLALIELSNKNQVWIQKIFVK